jgi:hypothetical protein
MTIELLSKILANKKIIIYLNFLISMLIILYTYFKCLEEEAKPAVS